MPGDWISTPRGGGQWEMIFHEMDDPLADYLQQTIASVLNFCAWLKCGRNLFVLMRMSVHIVVSTVITVYSNSLYSK